jgi:hypothetical protein
MQVPVMNEASSEARNKIALATSAGVPGRSSQFPFGTSDNGSSEQ